MHLLPQLFRRGAPLLQGAVLVAVLLVQVAAPTVTCAEHLFQAGVASHHHHTEAAGHQHNAGIWPAPPPGCHLEAPAPNQALLAAAHVPLSTTSAPEVADSHTLEATVPDVTSHPEQPARQLAAPPPRAA